MKEHLLQSNREYLRVTDGLEKSGTSKILFPSQAFQSNVRILNGPKYFFVLIGF